MPDQPTRREIVSFIGPQPPRYHHTDPDGDRLLVTTADIPGQGPGLYFKTDPQGSGVPLAELPALIDALREIAASTRPATPEEPTEAPATTADKAAALNMTPTEYRKYRHDAAVEQIRKAAGGLLAETGLRVMDALDSTTDQQPEPRPARQQWSVNMYDPVAETWLTGTPRCDRDEAAQHLERVNATRPTWSDGQPVRRRLVRSTTTYAIEDET